MYIKDKASHIRQKEAQQARDNRAEIVKALSSGQITRRDLYKWGIFTAAGLLAAKHGLSPFARSAYAAVPTGTPRSPLNGATKFSQRMHRLDVQQPIPLTRDEETGNAVFPSYMPERDAKRLSWHTDFTQNPSNPNVRNPLTNRGPIEGRPPGEVFAHQRWDEYFPQKPMCCRSRPAIPTAPISMKIWRVRMPTACGRTARARARSACTRTRPCAAVCRRQCSRSATASRC